MNTRQGIIGNDSASKGAGESFAGGSLGDGSGGGGHSSSPPSEGPPADQLPGYGAGYDAGFTAGLLAASHGDMQPPALGSGPAAAEGGAAASAPEPARPPMLALVEDFPALFQKEVLERLDPVDLALLGRTGSVVRTAVKRSGLPRVGGGVEGPRVGIAPFCQSLSTFVWAVANGCPWQLGTTCNTLARGGQLEVLRWAREHGCPWTQYTPYDRDACESAALGGHLEVLRWLREHGCRWDERTCSGAAQGGHLEVLSWAWEHGCPWDQCTCATAAEGGHLEVLKLARAHDCPWNEDLGDLDLDCCAQAARGGHLEAGAYTRRLFSSTSAVSDAKLTLIAHSNIPPTPSKHPLNDRQLHPLSHRKRLS